MAHAPHTLTIRLATPGDASLFPDATAVFDHPPRPALVAEFLACPRHHIVLALAPEIVGFVSGVHYIHPDKPAQYWINEVSTHEAHRRQGIGRAMMAATLAHARALGCSEAWVIADPTPIAMGFYDSLGAVRTGSHLAMYTFNLAIDVSHGA